MSVQTKIVKIISGISVLLSASAIYADDETTKSKVSVLQVTPSGTTFSDNPAVMDNGKIVISNPSGGADGVITLQNSDNGIVLSTGKAAEKDVTGALAAPSLFHPLSTPIPEQTPAEPPPTTNQQPLPLPQEKMGIYPQSPTDAPQLSEPLIQKHLKQKTQDDLDN